MPEENPENLLSEIRRRPLHPPIRRQGTDGVRQGPVTPLKRPAPRRSPGTSVPVNNITAPTAAVPLPAASKKLRPAKSPGRVRLGYRERMIVVSLLSLLVVAGVLAAIIFLPRANVKLILRTAPLLVDEQLTVRAEAAGAQKVVPGSAFFREVEVQEAASVQGTQVVGTKARGTVRLVNRSVDVQKIKEQSRLITKDNVLFYMLRSANVPANGSLNVEVEAAEAGEAGNIAPQRLNFAALDASSQTLVYAEATQALSGGTGETVAVIKDEDLARAKEMAGQAARGKVEQEIRGELPKDWIILEESWTQEVTTFETTAKIGDRQPTMPYVARVVVRVIGYEKAALEKHLQQALESRLDQDYMLFPGQIAYVTTVQNVNWEEAQAEISARVTHTTIPQFSLETLSQKLAGRSKKEAQEYLQGLPGVRSVNLDLSPFWVQSIPRIEKRIKLDLQPERQP